MEIKKRQVGDRATLWVAGELDFTSAGILEAEMAAQTARILEINLSGLTFLDSSGVGALLNGARELASKGCTLKVTNIPDEIRESMELIGFFQVMEALFPAEDTE